MNRRGFLTGLVSTLAAPAIVRAELLMPVKVVAPFDPMEAYYKLLNTMVNNLSEQVAKSIMNDGHGGSFPFGIRSLVGFKIHHDNITEGASCQIYPYQPLKIKPIWARGLFIDRPIKSPTNGF